MNVAVALLSALVFLPPMLVWADQRNWVSRGLVPAEILATATAEHDTHEAPAAGPRAAAARSRSGLTSGSRPPPVPHREMARSAHLHRDVAWVR